LKYLLGGDGHHGPWAEDGGGPAVVEVLVVLGGNHAADDDHDVFPVHLLECPHQLGQQNKVDVLLFAFCPYFIHLAVRFIEAFQQTFNDHKSFSRFKRHCLFEYLFAIHFASPHSFAGA